MSATTSLAFLVISLSSLSSEEMNVLPRPPLGVITPGVFSLSLPAETSKLSLILFVWSFTTISETSFLF